jgi:NAD(P)-dependent dehydrogenase (short-subunit alcohol dehydrogenase family)
MAGKTVLVTGGTGGIGRAAAVALAAMGARVGIVGRDRTRAEAAATAIAWETGNPAVDAFVADLSSQTDVGRLADEALATYPRINVLINDHAPVDAQPGAWRGHRRVPGELA